MRTISYKHRWAEMAGMKLKVRLQYRGSRSKTAWKRSRFGGRYNKEFKKIAPSYILDLGPRYLQQLDSNQKFNIYN